MGLYNFQPRFVAPIREGVKRQTIRATRKHPDKPGSRMHLYTGLRTKNARIIDIVTCTSVHSILIGQSLFEEVVIEVDGWQLDPVGMSLLAFKDGFDSLPDFLEFWRGRLPFKGHIYSWAPVAG